MAESKGRGPKLDRSSLRNLYGRIFKHKKALLGGIIALVGVDGLQLLIPQVFRKLIDSVAQGTADSDLVWRMGLSVVAIALGMAFCRFFWRIFIVGASRRLEKKPA